MKNRILALVTIFVLIFGFAMPSPSFAKPPWWDRFKDIVVADAIGALDGFLMTENLGGAIAGGVLGSLKEGFDKGVSPGTWKPDDLSAPSVGLHHNLALSYYASQDADANVNDILIKYFKDNRIPFDEREIGIYLRGINPTIEDFLKRIREGTTGPFNPEMGSPGGVIVSENFIANLNKTLSILEGDSDDPQKMLDEAIVFFINASLRETDKDLRDEIITKAQDYNSSRSNKRGGILDLGGDDGRLNFDKIEITYKEQKSKGQPSDIILAWIFVDVLQHSSLYWSEVYCWGEADDNGSLWCWGANFEKISITYDYPDFLDVDSDGDSLPDLTFELVLTLNQNRARSGNAERIMDVAPFAREGRTFVPFRFIGEELGAEIGWIQETRTVTYSRGEGENLVVIEMVLGQNIALVNGKEKPIDENPSIVAELVNNRTLVPLRFISEALGFDVDWDPVTREVKIK